MTIHMSRNLRLMFNTVFVDASHRSTLNDDTPVIYGMCVQTVF